MNHRRFGEGRVNLTHATPNTGTECLDQLALLLKERRVNLVQRNAADAEVMDCGVAIWVVLVEELGVEDVIGGVQRLEDVIARGSEEDADRGDTAGGSHLEQATDETHLGCWNGGGVGCGKQRREL